MSYDSIERTPENVALINHALRLLKKLASQDQYERGVQTLAELSGLLHGNFMFHEDVGGGVPGVIVDIMLEKPPSYRSSAKLTAVSIVWDVHCYLTRWQVDGSDARELKERLQSTRRLYGRRAKTSRRF